MPDNRQHRGPNPRDHELFSSAQIPAIQSAGTDYCVLLDMGYPKDASLKLVGDRFNLQQRQRMAVARSSCTSQEADARRQKEVGRRKERGGSIPAFEMNDPALPAAPRFDRIIPVPAQDPAMVRERESIESILALLGGTRDVRSESRDASATFSQHDCLHASTKAP